MALKSRRHKEVNVKAKIFKVEKKPSKKSDEKDVKGTIFLQDKGFVVFGVGNEWFCIDLDLIYEILHDYSIAPASHLPPFFEGIINLRGESIPVVNIRNLLNLSPVISEAQVCIVSFSEGIKTGFLVDSDIEIVKSSDVQIFPLPDCYSAEERKFLDGIIDYKNRLIGILKPNQALKTITEWRSKDEDK